MRNKNSLCDVYFFMFIFVFLFIYSKYFIEHMV